MKTRTFRHKNSKTRKSKKGGISDAARAAAFAFRNPKTTAAMAKTLSVAKGVGNKANEVGANLGNRLNQVKNSNQAQEAMKGITNIKNKGMEGFNKAMNSEQVQEAMKKLRKKKNEFSNMASNFMNKGGRKWSLKYKRSINCKRPKGFSQKQHCKYGRRKSRRTRKSRK